MNKADLIAEIAKSANISKYTAQKALDAAITSVKNALKEGDKVTLAGFGTFTVSKRAARIGRNPRTGCAIKISESRVPKFSAGSNFRKAVLEASTLPGKPTTLPRPPK